MEPDSTDYIISDVVRSQAGRDADGLFYVIGTDGEFLLLADGKARKIESPKRKKNKHVQLVATSSSRTAEKIRSGIKITRLSTCITV